jgi:hypothetical protein
LPVILPFGRVRQLKQEIEASLGYKARLSQKIKNKSKRKFTRLYTSDCLQVLPERKFGPTETQLFALIKPALFVQSPSILLKRGFIFTIKCIF